MTLSELVERRRLLVVVGTGGVGKTTLSAALALGAAERGRRAIVLTIDPARALGRAFGTELLGSEPSPVLLASGSGTLDAAMLDRQRAWDALISRHAPSEAVARRVLDNAFYRRLSSRFAGATEYAAMEQLCRLHETGRWDLVVLDTPPSAHAFDFVAAPDRIDRLLDPELARWLVQPGLVLGRSAARAGSATVRLLVRRIERATGRGTLREIADFFAAFGQSIGEVRRRSKQARGLLRDPRTAFVLVTGPRQDVLDGARAMLETVTRLEVPLSAVVVNRVQRLAADGHALPDSRAIAELVEELGRAGASEGARDWLGRVWSEAGRLSELETGRIARFRSELPFDLVCTTVPELDHDLHALDDLRAVAEELYAR